MNKQSRISRDELRTRALNELRVGWQSSLTLLPSEAADWPAGGAYIRESDAESLEGAQPVVQLEAILNDALTRRIRIDWQHVYFEQISGTELDPRVQFRRLIAEAGQAGHGCQLVALDSPQSQTRRFADAGALLGLPARQGLA